MNEQERKVSEMLDRAKAYEARANIECKKIQQGLEVEGEESE